MCDIAYINDPVQLPGLVQELENQPLAAIDLETTGLDPRRSNIRLLSISTPAFTRVVDAYFVDLQPVLNALHSSCLVGHNLQFDLLFLMHAGFEPGPAGVQDTMILSQLLSAGEGLRHNLAAVAERYLGKSIDKALQVSDWSGDLTKEQIEYSARDTAILLPLREVLTQKVHDAGMDKVAQIEHDCVPALTWMTYTGAPIDIEAWSIIASQARSDVEDLTRQLDELAPSSSGSQLTLPGMEAPGWLWTSPDQALNALRAAGIDLKGTRDWELGTVDHPLARLLRKHRAASKLQSSYGEGWLENVSDGRVYPRWWQLGASSGRMACSQPNMQQIPRGSHRACVRAPAGHQLIKADYSQIELRIAACITEDPSMLQAYKEGLDLHILTAREVLGKEEVSRSDRQLAKAINFGLLYGMGAAGFQNYASGQYGVEINLDQAALYHRKFFERYRGLAAWHRNVRNRRDEEVRTLAGRRSPVRPDTSLPVRLNLPVQGTGADGLKIALGLLWKRRTECPGAVPIIVCHDEIVVECPDAIVEQASAWLAGAMLDGMNSLIAPVRAEVEVQIGTTWGG